MDKKEQKEKLPKKVKKPAGKVRGLVGVVVAAVLALGVCICDMATTGKNMFSCVSTGSVWDRFDEETAEKSKLETMNFFMQGATLYTYSNEQKYTSYTLNYTATIALKPEYNEWTYTSAWKDVTASVDKDYTVCRISQRYAEAMTYRRVMAEYVICKTGKNAGRAWVRSGTADQAVPEVDVLEKAAWTEVTGGLTNEMYEAAALLLNATFTGYDFLEGEFKFAITASGESGHGTLQPGVMPKMTFSYNVEGERKEQAYHEWVCSNLNATKVVVPQSLRDIIGG